MKREPKPIADKKQAVNYSLRLLLMRDYSSAMIAEKLRLRHCGEDIIKETVDELSASGYIDDRDYAARLVKSMVNFRKKGIKYIEYELKRKGIEEDIIREVLEENYVSSIDEAVSGILKKYPQPFEELDYKERNKIINKLLRMGYSYSEITDSIRGMN